MTVLFEALRW